MLCCHAQDVLWFSMREEPVVYINGLPFVLREQRRPLKNLQVRMFWAFDMKVQLLSWLPAEPYKS